LAEREEGKEQKGTAFEKTEARKWKQVSASKDSSNLDCYVNM